MAHKDGKPYDAIAIDLGTTNSVFGGILGNGEPVTITNLDGKMHTPSFIWVSENEETHKIEFCVGDKAKELMFTEPDNVLSSYKPLMGTDTCIKVVKDRAFTAELCSAAALSYIRKSAERFLDVIVSRAIITIPAYFSDLQKGSTKRAAEQVGLEVIRLVAEPTAAGYYYGKIKDKGNTEPQTILAYDLGGGTFDVSLLQVLPSGDVVVMFVDGDSHLGGDNIDQALAMLIAKKSKVNWEELTLNLKERVIRLAEVAKVELSTAHYNGDLKKSHKVPVSSVFPELKDVNITMNEFLTELRPFIQRTLDVVKRVLTETQAEPDEVLLIGGSSRLPLIREGLEDMLNNPKFNKEYFAEYMVDPDMAVALGARLILKNILEGSEDNITDATALPLGIEMANGDFNVVINAGAILPARGAYSFTNAFDGQTEVSFGIYEGRSKQVKDNQLLGTIKVPIPAVMKGEVTGMLTLRVNKEGIISGRCIVNDQSIKIKLNRYYDNVTDTLESIGSDTGLDKEPKENNTTSNGLPKAIGFGKPVTKMR